MAGPKQIIGLDLGTHSVKVARLDAQNGAVLSVDVYPIEIPDASVSDDEATAVRTAPEADATTDYLQPEGSPPWVSVLSDIYADEDVAKSFVATNAPDEIVAAIHIDVPFSDREKVSSVIVHLLADELPIDVKKSVFDFYAFDKPNGEGAEAVVGFAKAEDIEAFLAELSAYSFDPAILALPPLTRGMHCATLFRDQEEPVAVVDIGHSFSNIVVIDDGKPVLARNNRAAGKKITETLATRFNVPFSEAEQIKHQYAAIVDGDAPNEQMRIMSDTIKEALRSVVRDIRRSLQGLYAKTGREVSTVYVCGGTSQVKNLERFMSAELGIPVRRLQNSDVGPDIQAISVMALGLAKNYADARTKARTVNLRQGAFAFTGFGSPLQRMLIRFGLVALAVLVVLGGVFYLQKLGQEARRDAMEKELGIISKRVFGERVMSSSEVRKRLAGEGDDSEQFVPKLSAYQLLYDVTKQIDKDVELELTRVEVDISRNVIQLVGKTKDAQAVDRVVSDLREIECFKKVTPGKTKIKDDEAEFDVQISSGCS